MSSEREYVVEVKAGYEVVFSSDEVQAFTVTEDGTLVVDTGADETRFYPGVVERWYVREVSP